MNDDQVQNRFEQVTEKNRNLAREKKQMRQQKDEANAFHALQKETVCYLSSAIDVWMMMFV